MSYWERLTVKNPSLADCEQLHLTPAELRRIVDQAENFGREQATAKPARSGPMAQVDEMFEDIFGRKRR